MAKKKRTNPESLGEPQELPAAAHEPPAPRLYAGGIPGIPTDREIPSSQYAMATNETSRRRGRPTKKSAGPATIPAAVLVSRRIQKKTRVSQLVPDTVDLSIEENAQAMAAQLLESALDIPDRKGRIWLVKQALEIFPDLPEAYSLLARSAKKVEKTLELLKTGVGIAERQLEEGESTEQRRAARNYFAMKYSLALCLLRTKKTAKAVRHFEELLALNPEDDLCLRFPLMACLLRQNKDSEVKKLLDRFVDTSASWAYTYALIAFRKNTPASRQRASRLLTAAFRLNGFVPNYLLDRVRQDRKQKETAAHIPGSQALDLKSRRRRGTKEGTVSAIRDAERDEAIVYSTWFAEAWRKTATTRKWLEDLYLATSNSLPQPGEKPAQLRVHTK